MACWERLKLVAPGDAVNDIPPGALFICLGGFNQAVMDQILRIYEVKKGGFG